MSKKNSGAFNLMIQGKGGVGKTTSAVLFGQFLQSDGRNLKNFDGDPINASLSEFQALKAAKISLMLDNVIDPRAFDGLMEEVLATDADCLVDTGSSVFAPISAYMIENKAIEYLIAHGKRVIIHVVILAGQALEQTISGFESIASQFPEEAQLVVWLNEYHGPIEVDGLQFEDLAVFKEHSHRVLGLIRIPRKTERTFLEDLREMLRRKLTFDEAIASPEFYVMSKQRLEIYKEIIFKQLRALPL